MDLLNGLGLSAGGGAHSSSTSHNTLNVIAPDHPFWSQALTSPKPNILMSQFSSQPEPEKKTSNKCTPGSTEELGLGNLKSIGSQSFYNNGIENSVPLDDVMNNGTQSNILNYPSNLRLAPIGSSSAYQMSETLPDRSFVDNANQHAIRQQPNISIVNNQRQSVTSDQSPKSNSSVQTKNAQENNKIWPERSQYPKQKPTFVESNGVGPRFKNMAINKSNPTSPSSNVLPMSSVTFVNKSQPQQPPRLSNKKYQQSTPRNGASVQDNVSRPMAYDDSSISLSSSSEEEEEEDDDYVSTDTGTWIYIAKSNIWVDSKKQNKSGTKYNKGTTSEDKKLRLDLGKLTELVRKGRQVIDLQCYGSEPPDMDTVWKLAKKKGWTSLNGPKSNKDLQADATISTDIMELVSCSHLKNLRFEKCKNVVVLIANETESDLTKVIGKIMNQEGWWKIEIWSTKDTLSSNIKELSIEYPDIIEINYLDEQEVREKFQFTHYKLDLKGKVDKIDKRWLYNYGIVFEDVNLEIGSYVSEAFQKIIKDLNWPYKYVWMNDEKNKSEVHLNLLILFERPNSNKGAKEKSEFLGEYLPKLRNSLLNDLCRRILSYHEYDKEKNDDDDEISFTNRYSFLSDVKDEEDELESPEIPDEPVNAPFDLFEELEKQEELLNNTKEKEWEQVIHKTRGNAPSPAQIYSTRCIYGFICTYGTKCHYEHTNEEKQLFQARTAAKKIGKVPFHDNKYRTELCNFNIPHDRAACPFAHGMTQMICKVCYKCGHSVETCTVKETVT